VPAGRIRLAFIVLLPAVAAVTIQLVDQLVVDPGASPQHWPRSGSSC
jgi:hypothetical protein